ncbi:MAG: hypothetical protein R3E90_06600 [Marinicella sp.]
MSQNKTFIFSHIPKTAGTSLKVHFQNHLINEIEFIHFANVGFNSAKKNGLKPFDQRSEESRAKAKVILGHKVNYKTKMLVKNNEVDEVVIFRDPIAWEISRFNQHANRLYKQNKRIIDFKYWLSNVNKTHSQFAWFLANYLLLGSSVSKLNKQALENLLFYTLSNFKHVLFLDNMNEQISPVYYQLGISSHPGYENSVGKHKIQYFENTTDNQRLLQNICEPEIIIYEKLRSYFS